MASWKGLLHFASTGVGGMRLFRTAEAKYIRPARKYVRPVTALRSDLGNMNAKSYGKVITPFLMGQRRDGLRRVQDVDSGTWTVSDAPIFRDVKIVDSDEKIRRMAEVYSLLSQRIAEIAGSGAIPVSIAGDCVSTLGVLAGLQKANRQPDRLLWLDAHGDFHTWETTQTQYIGGMPLAMLVGRGDQRIVARVGLSPYPEDRIVLSDGRDLDPGEREALARSKIVRCRIDRVLECLPPDEALYVHWDTDVVDAEREMPALKYIVESGPGYSDMASLFKSLAGRDIVAISVSAWHAERDLDNRTARASLALLHELGVPLALA
jgi:arginase